MAFLFAIQADHLSRKGGFSRLAGGASLGHDDASFVEGCRVDVSHFEQVRSHSVLPQDRLAAMVAFHVQQFGIEFSVHATTVSLSEENDKRESKNQDE